MEDTPLFIFFLTGSLSTIIISCVFFWWRVGSFQKLAQTIIEKAEEDAKQLISQTENTVKERLTSQEKDLQKLWDIERKKILREEEKILLKETKLESKASSIQKKLAEVNYKETFLAKQEAELLSQTEKNKQLQIELSHQLEKISGITSQEAKEILMTKMMVEVQSDTASYIKRACKEAEEVAELEAKKIIATTISRLSTSSISEMTINTVSLPNEDLKGRIIGREGRNIKALEQATGVSFLVDETPGAIVLSCFDPVRMYTAKLILQELIADGRIHPSRIEELMEKTKQQVKKKIRQYGEDAALRSGAINMHPELLDLLGKLKFRFSYGQNILEHSIEVSHIMGIMASELSLDVSLAKRIGLLHDIGKAMTHEMEGSHAIIGHDLCLKYGESKEVANGVGCHHKEISPYSIEASLCGAADAISAGRPGARIEPLEEYVKRLKKLESIANEMPCVEKAYALQAGKELRIFVTPDLIEEDQVILLAREITKRIEKELTYPGKIKVTVIREKRITEYAL